MGSWENLCIWRFLLPKFSWLLWKFPLMSTLKAILLLKICWITVKPLFPGVSFKLTKEMECCITLIAALAQLIACSSLQYALGEETKLWKPDPAHFKTREIQITHFLLQGLEKRLMYLSGYVVCNFSFLPNYAINIVPQSVRSFSVPVCSPNLREYYKDLPVQGIGAVTF